MEFCDYIPALLAGDTRPEVLLRSVCAAGHKAMYCEEWGGLPDAEFCSLLDPRMGELRARLFDKAHPADVCAGRLCAEWAGKTGLPEGIPIAVGAFDAHFGGVGSGVAIGTLVTSWGHPPATSPLWPQTAERPRCRCLRSTARAFPGYLGIECGAVGGWRHLQLVR